MKFKTDDLVVCDGTNFCPDTFCPWKHPRFVKHTCANTPDAWWLCSITINKYSVTLRLVKIGHRALNYSKEKFIKFKQNKNDAHRKKRSFSIDTEQTFVSAANPFVETNVTYNNRQCGTISIGEYPYGITST